MVTVTGPEHRVGGVGLGSGHRKWQGLSSRDPWILGVVT